MGDHIWASELLRVVDLRPFWGVVAGDRLLFSQDQWAEPIILAELHQVPSINQDFPYVKE